MCSVGILALQGGVVEHEAALRKLGCSTVQVRKPRQLKNLSALILPGGESTTLISLMNRWALTKPVIQMGKSGVPLLGTCAGAILLSRRVKEAQHDVDQESLALADVEAVRNYFGRQTCSFVQDLDIEGLDQPFRGVFIRAPILRPLSDSVQVLGTVRDGAVLLRQDNIWLSSFHPELTPDTSIHRLFLKSHGLLKGTNNAHL